MFTRLLLLAFSLITIQQLSYSQAFWTQDKNHEFLRFEYVKSSITADYYDYSYHDFGTLNGNYYLSGSFMLSEKFRMYLELPLAFYSGTKTGSLYGRGPDRSEPFSRDILGNPLVMVEHTLSDYVSGEYGVRIPVYGILNEGDASSDDVRDIPIYSDLLRGGAFEPENMTFRGLLRIRMPFGRSGVGLYFRGGLFVYANVAGRDGSAYGAGSLMATFDFDAVRFAFGPTTAFTPEKFFGEFGAAVNIQVGQFSPGIALRLPFGEDEYWATFNRAVEFNLTYSLLNR